MFFLFFFFLFLRRCSFALLSLITTSSFLCDVDGERENKNEVSHQLHSTQNVGLQGLQHSTNVSTCQTRARKSSSREKKIKKSKAPITTSLSRPFETYSLLLLLHQNATEIHAHVASNADLNNNNNNGSREQRDGRTNTGA